MRGAAAIALLIAAFAILALLAPPDLPRLALDGWQLRHPAATLFGNETFTAQGQPTGAPGWAGAALAGALYSLSPAALSIANGCFAALALGALAALALRGARPAIVAAVAALAALATQSGWGSGTLGLELLMATAFCGALLAKGRWIYAAIPVAVIWCNLSVSGLIAPVLALAVAAGAIVEERGATPRLRALAIVFVGCVFGTACTPGGAGFAADALAHLGIFESTVEAFVLWDPSSRPLAILAGFAPMLALCAWAGDRNGGGWPAAALAACAAVLGLASAPLMPIAAFIIAPALAAAIESTFGSAFDRAGATRSGLAAAGLVAVCAAVAAAGVYRSPRDDRGAAAAVASARAAGAGRFYCSTPAWCNYAVASGAGVFVDGRISSYPVKRREDAVTVARTEKDWKGVLKRWRVDAVVCARDRPLAQLLALDSRWRRLPDSGEVAVFVLAGPPA